MLGDRVRMMVHHSDEGVFVRSMASRGRQGGLAWATAELVHLLDAAGFPVILVETVGTGQDGIDIAALAQTTVVVEAPGLGDGVQAIKSGLLEVADIVVVNKADQAGADEARRVLRTTLDLARSVDRPRTPVLATAANQGEGIAKLNCAIASHLTWLQESGELARRRQLGLETEVLVAIRLLLHRSLATNSAQSSRFQKAIGHVVGREMTPRRDSRHSRCVIRALRIRRADTIGNERRAEPAPIPLSIMTTVNPGAQDRNMEPNSPMLQRRNRT